MNISFVYYSKATDRWVKEDATREVGVVKLREWSLLFEVFLDS